MISFFNFALIGTLSLFAETTTVNAFDVEPYPTFRFREYSDLSLEQKSAATSLGYNEIAWNQPGTADVESLSWWYNVNMDYYDIDQDGDYYENNPAFDNAAATLGFAGIDAESVWDCWINHYGSYTWDQLVEYDIAPSYMDLGWSPESWNETLPVPDSENKDFAEFTDKEKTAAVTVCYTQSIWDNEVLPFCHDSSGTIGNSSETCDWASKNISRCNLEDGQVSKHCPNTCGNSVPLTDSDSGSGISTVSRFVLSTIFSCVSIFAFLALN